MKNFVVDVIFWGNFCTGSGDCAPQQPQQQDVLDYINDLTSYLRGVGTPTGLEPAVRSYGVSQILPGTYVVGPSSLGSYGSPGTDNAGIDEISSIVAAAQSGSYGPSYTFSGGYNSPSLPTGSNRLAVVVAIGANVLDDYGPADGFHVTNNGTIVAGERWEDRAALSHEILEAMTDANPHTGWCGGVEASFTTYTIPYLGGFAVPSATFTEPEAADQCEGGTNIAGDGSIPFAGHPLESAAFEWTGTVAPNNDISGLASIIVNQPFAFPNFPFPQASCEVFVPEQHTPMAATFEYGGNGTQPLVLYYLEPNGHLASLTWGNVGYSASGPYDIGQPALTVTAVGKPSVVYSLYAGGERVFTRGSDGALWMYYNGSWTSLGGQIFSDPSAVVWDNGLLIDIFALGTDDQLYFYGMTGNQLYGWSAVPNMGTAFVGSPTVVSRTPMSFDLFLVGENGASQWIPYSASAGWGQTQLTNFGSGIGMIGAPAVTVPTSNYMDVFQMDGMNMWHTAWNGSSWGPVQSAMFQLFSPEGNYGLEGSPATVSWGAARTDVFAVSRYGSLWWWYSTQQPNGYTWTNGGPGTYYNPLPLVAGGVGGDPLAISRGANELEVFYRTSSGSLEHMTLNNGAWSFESVLSRNSIQ